MLDLEEAIDLFQREIGSLNVPAVNDRNKTNVEDGVNEIVLPPDILNRSRRNDNINKRPAHRRSNRRLRLPDGDGDGVHAVADAGDDAPDDHGGEGVGRCLEDAADDEDDAASSAEFVADEYGEQCAHYAADVVRGNNLALDCGAGVVECVEESLVAKQTAEDALIVAKE